jgi:hypothetical protein
MKIVGGRASNGCGGDARVPLWRQPHALIALVLLVSWALLPAAAQAAGGDVTVIGSTMVTPGHMGNARVMCPAGMVAVSGGVDPENVFTEVVTSSAPVFAANDNRLLFQPNGINPGPTGWQASVRNNDTTDKVAKVAAVCRLAPGAVAVVGSTNVNPNGFDTVSLHCPSGMVAVGGGVDPGNVLTEVVTASAPMFGTVRLLLRADGPAPAPDGWYAGVRNNDTVAKPFKAAVVCTALHNASARVDSGVTAVGDFGVLRVMCPGGTVAVGGGIDPQNVFTEAVTSSGPVFAANDHRLLFQPNGLQPGAIGWQATILNQSTESKSFKVATICAQPIREVFLPYVRK